ncbi:MAG: CPBP family intramembrane glutamic endopeptidase [Oscillospiraceae bacterium]|nr:CPBP family intramembrane glutamic endopeptidase [Oscillospiraceae bacterium]
MSNPKGKALPDLISMYLIMLVIYCLDVFFLKSDLTVLGDNFYSRFLCLTVLLMTVVFKREHFITFGIRRKATKLKSAFIFGTFFSVVPIVTVSIFEYIFFKIIYPNAIDIDFTPPSLSYVQTEGYLTPALCIAIYILTSLFAACFKEMFFRGFLLHKLEKLTTLKVANIFQALLYMTFVIPKLIRNFAMNYYSEDIVKLAAFVVIFYLVHEFITGLKWGMLAKVSGAVYISIIDNFLYVFLANSLHIVDQSTKWLFMIHMLATQLISLALVVIYCKKASSAKSVEEKTIEKKSTVAAKEKTKNPAPIETHEEKEVINIEDFNDKAEISPSQFKEIIKENTVQSALPHNGELSEEEIDSYLKDFGKPKGQYNPPKTSKPDMAKETVESFDVDDFLKGFSNS